MTAGTGRVGSKVALVTGAGSGIGRATAVLLASEGATVLVADINEAAAQGVVAEITSAGGEAEALPLDVTDEVAWQEAVGRVLAGYGRLDVLVNNAGVPFGKPVAEMSLDEWHRVLQVNLDGAFLCLREAARVLVQQGQGGSLLGVSSTSAIHGAPGQEHYSASKTALLGVMRSLAVELARHQIRCNSLLPGWTETELTAAAMTHEKFMAATTGRTPVRRWATLHDFETVGAFLADPTLIFHTGDSMVVDGGYTVF